MTFPSITIEADSTDFVESQGLIIVRAERLARQGIHIATNTDDKGTYKYAFIPPIFIQDHERL